MAKSPYQNMNSENWYKKTAKLVKDHPLTEKQIVDSVIVGLGCNF